MGIIRKRFYKFMNLLINAGANRFSRGRIVWASSFLVRMDRFQRLRYRRQNWCHASRRTRWIKQQPTIRTRSSGKNIGMVAWVAATTSMSIVMDATAASIVIYLSKNKIMGTSTTVICIHQCYPMLSTYPNYLLRYQWTQLIQWFQLASFLFPNSFHLIM